MVCVTGLIQDCAVNDNSHANKPLLAVNELNVAIHDTVILHHVSLRVKPGKTLGVIGESGSGKSMTALSIMQLLPRGSRVTGSINFSGKELTTLDDADLCALRGSDIGMIFQEPMSALNPVQSIGEQVSESIRLHRRVSRREALQLTVATLERVGLPNLEFPLGRYPHELSGGQRQRVVIAIAVACQPQLLIADEPTTALDVTTQAGILDLLKSLQRDEGLALMLITHDLAVVANIADDVVIMRDGHVVEQGDLHTVFENPRHEYTRMLLAASSLNRIVRSKQDTVSKPTLLPAGSTVNKVSQPIAADPIPDAFAAGSSSVGGTAPEAELPGAAPLLQVENLICEYPGMRTGWFSSPGMFRAVDEVSLDIQYGESVGLVGESGCGKSTLTRALLGLMPLHSGSIRLNGESVSTAKEVSHKARQQMQVVFQDPYGSFNPRHKVGRLVSEPLHVLDESLSNKETARRVAQVLTSVGLVPNDSDKYIHEFSGGQRQRIAIARALIIHPRLIILDEAVSALDVSVRAQVLELLDKLADNQGLAYLFISHDLSVVQRVTDRVLVMHDGRIVEEGDTRAVLSYPRHPYTQRLVAAAPKLPSWLYI